MTAADPIVATPFRVADLEEMAVQPEQGDPFRYLTRAQLAALEASDAWTARIGGEVMLCGGLAEIWEGRAMLWSYVSANAGAHMLRLTRGVARYLDAAPYWRVEAYVRQDFAAGHRWARVLGMEAESVAREFLPGRSDATIYVKRK